MAARMHVAGKSALGRGVRHAPSSTRLRHIAASHPGASAILAAVAVAPVAEPPVKQGWWQKDCPDNMVNVNSAQELVNLLAANRDRLVVVDFYASWCHSCRSLFPKMKKLVADNPDVLVLKVNFDDNKQLCKGLNVKVLPYFHMYKGAEGRVDAFTCSIAKIQRFKDALDTHGAPFCSLGDELPFVPEFPEVQPQPSALPPHRLAHCLPDIQELAKEGQQAARDFAAGFQQQQRQQRQQRQQQRQQPPAFA